MEMKIILVRMLDQIHILGTMSFHMRSAKASQSELITLMVIGGYAPVTQFLILLIHNSKNKPCTKVSLINRCLSSIIGLYLSRMDHVWK